MAVTGQIKILEVFALTMQHHKSRVKIWLEEVGPITVCPTFAAEDDGKEKHQAYQSFMAQADYYVEYLKDTLERSRQVRVNAARVLRFGAEYRGVVFPDLFDEALAKNIIKRTTQLKNHMEDLEKEYHALPRHLCEKCLETIVTSQE